MDCRNKCGNDSFACYLQQSRKLKSLTGQQWNKSGNDKMGDFGLAFAMIKTCIAYLAFLLLLTTPALAADWEGVFEGTLGKSVIIVELNAGQDASSYKGGYSEGSRYSYLPAAYDLKLVLESEGKTLEFLEGTQSHDQLKDLPKEDPAWTGHWSLKVTGKTAVGRWSSATGTKTLPIVLKRLPLVSRKDVPQDFNQLAVTYNERWFKAETFSGATRAKAFGQVKLAFERDAVFKLETPVFTALPDKARMARANGLLRRYYKSSLIANRDCINGLNSEKDAPKEPEYNFEVVYASERVVTISEGGSVFCGGAHPNNYATYLTFDLVKNKQIGGAYQLDLSPKGFGEVLKLANRAERVAFETFALDRWQAKAKAAADPDHSCSDPNFMGEQVPGEKEFTLGFDTAGLLVFRTDYPNAAANCMFQDYNPTVIPWADLKPFLRADQTLLTTEIK